MFLWTACVVLLALLHAIQLPLDGQELPALDIQVILHGGQLVLVLGDLLIVSHERTHHFRDGLLLHLLDQHFERRLNLQHPFLVRVLHVCIPVDLPVLLLRHCFCHVHRIHFHK